MAEAGITVSCVSATLKRDKQDERRPDFMNVKCKFGRENLK